jgi:3D (Asp-Asp-Asp) domain-containing protein
MKLFVRGGVGLVATLFASFLIFQAQPLSAITNPSQQPAQQQEQPQKKESAGTNQQTESSASVRSETAEVSTTSASAPSTVAVKDSDLKAAATLKINSAEKKSAGLTAPQPYIAFSYSWCCRGASGLGTRRGTIAADPRILPYGTRVYIEGAGSYNGEYLVTDAGTAIKGNKIDVWVPTLKEARRFGRKNVKLTVLSYGARRGTKRAR